MLLSYPGQIISPADISMRREWKDVVALWEEGVGGIAEEVVNSFLGHLYGRGK